MDLKTFLEQTEPEVLEKLASDAQDELVSKVIEAILPLFEKTAAYTAHLVLEKLSEEKEEKEEEKPKTEEEAVRAEFEKNKNNPNPLAPPSASKDNTTVDPSITPGGLKAQDVKDAIAEAITVGQPDKILPFVKAIAQQYPDAVNEIIKMVKVELHDGIMKKTIDEQSALSITDQLNSMVGV